MTATCRLSRNNERDTEQKSHRSTRNLNDNESSNKIHSHSCFFATCHPGLEEVVAAELCSPLIGAQNVSVGSSGVAFSGTLETGYRANLWLRCAVRILHQLASEPLNPETPAGESVYEFVKSAVDWPQLLEPPSPGRASSLSSNFSVESRVWGCTNITNSNLATTRAKDAVCDALKDEYGGRRTDPPPPGTPADLPLFLSLFRDTAVLYRDMSGDSLHKRGYREAMHRASLNEGLAAGALSLAGAGTGGHIWREGAEGGEGGDGMVLVDPMCGSGTLLIEAALAATNRAPGLMRQKWPFETWVDFDLPLWRSLRAEAVSLQRPLPAGVRLLGNDIHPGSLSLAARDAAAAGVRQYLELTCGDCRDFEVPGGVNLVVVNPPWGTRLGETSGEEGDWLADTWRCLGHFLKAQCRNAEVFVLSGNSSITRELQMRADKKWPVTSGGIDCRILRYKVLPPKPIGLSEHRKKVEKPLSWDVEEKEQSSKPKQKRVARDGVKSRRGRGGRGTGDSRSFSSSLWDDRGRTKLESGEYGSSGADGGEGRGRKNVTSNW